MYAWELYVYGRDRMALFRVTELVHVCTDMSTFSCPYCPEEYSAPSETLLLTYIRRVHANDPNFSIQCSLNGCERTFTNFRTYQNHRLTHRDEVSTVPPTDDADQSGECSGLDALPLPDISPTTTDIQSFAAKWILKTRETWSLTRTAMQGVIEDVSDLVDFVTQTLESQTRAVLQTHGIEPGSICGLNDVFTGPAAKPFEGLTSFHQQLQYCQSTFNLVVSVFTVYTSNLRVHVRDPWPPLCSGGIQLTTHIHAHIGTSEDCVKRN